MGLEVKESLKKYVDDLVAASVKRVGAVVIRAFNIEYQAATDGYIKAYDTSLIGEADPDAPMVLLCDAGTPPTLTRDNYKDTDGNTLGGVSWLVAKDEYWRVNWAYTGVVLWRPLEP